MNPPETTTRRPRLLLVAYACSPQRGSECAVGWHRALQAARYCDTWVICEEHDYGPEIRAELERSPVAGLQFCFLPMTPSQRRWVGVPGIYYRAYHGWHRAALERACELHEQVGFDLVHQVNYCGFREPGYAWKLPVPFVWGPLGGTQNLPSRFLLDIGWRGTLVESTRTVLNRWQLSNRRRVRSAAQKASVVLAANSTNQRDLSRAHGIRAELQLETGLPQAALNAHPRKALDGGLRILWSGQFQPFKALPMLLKALASIRDRCDFRLRVLGDGRSRRAWQAVARRCLLEDRIEWLGWQPYHEAKQQLEWADVLAFTSLRDTSGNVMLEALAEGVPVIGMDHQGCRDIMTDECGIRVPVTNPESVVAGLRDAVLRIADDDGLRCRLAEGALQRADYYSWERQGARMAEVYERVLAADAPQLLPLRPRDVQAETELAGGSAHAALQATAALAREASG